MKKQISFESKGLELVGNLYIKDVQSPIILLLHGLGFYSFEYEKLAPLLVLKGFNCLAFDFRSHGASQGKRGQWTLKDLIDDVISAIDYLYSRLQGPLGVFGNSLGATVAVFAAAQDNRIKSVVACNCATKPAETFFTPFRKALFQVFKSLSFLPLRLNVNYFLPYNKILNDPKIIERVKADKLISDARKFSIGTYNEMYQWDATKAVSTLTVPLLIIQSTLDHLQPPTQSEMLFKAANQPKKWALINSGHVPELENPKELSQMLGDWFTQTL
jgi:pimeloyl-ACP methyl ester carboxylesterase